MPVVTNIEDRRRDTIVRPFCYIVARDSFCSGWRHQPAVSLIAWPMLPGWNVDRAMIAIDTRSDTRNVRTVTTMRADGTPVVRCSNPSAHLSVQSIEDGARYARPDLDGVE